MTPLVLEAHAVKRCHAQVPDLPHPVPAISYRKQFYSYVKSFPNIMTAQEVGARLLAKGDSIILTPIPKGAVLWAWEPDATLASRKSDRLAS